MYDFEAIKALKPVTDQRDQQRSEQARLIYKQALGHIKRYKRINSKRDLIQATNKLFEAVRLYRKMVEPYVWLAYIFQIMDRDDISLKYLKIAETFDPDFPQIIKLKVLIEQKHAINPETVSTYEEIVKERQAKAKTAGAKKENKTLEEKNIEQLINFANPIKILTDSLINRITGSPGVNKKDKK